MPLTLTRPLVFFDLETTGTAIANGRIVEISLLKLYLAPLLFSYSSPIFLVGFPTKY